MKQEDNSQNSLKKQPKQERSKLLVSSIYDATARILERFGVNGTTTNKIAETTGISVGSLYQYFPNKDSILSKLIERVENEMGVWLEEELKKNNDYSFEVAIENITHAFVDKLISRKKFLSPLFLEAPRLKKTDEILECRRARIELMVNFTLKKHPELDRTLLEKRYWIVTNAIMGVIQSSIFEKDQSLSANDLKVQLTQMTKASARLITRQNQECSVRSLLQFRSAK